jgi:hypothetical protein
MPQVQSPLTVGRTMSSGGTTVASSSSGGWFLLAAVVLIAGAVALFTLRSKEKSTSPVAAVSGDAGTDQVDEIDDTDEFDEPSDDGGVGDEDAAGADILEDLNAKLAELRVWSSVEEDDTDDTIVRIVSAHCGDDNLRKAVKAYASAIKDVGYVVVQCFSPHGGLEFEQPL